MRLLTRLDWIDRRVKWEDGGEHGIQRRRKTSKVQ